MKAILIDDEYYALQGLRIELEEVGDIEIAGMFENAFSALENITTINPDVIFLDIEMPEINGLELFQKILEIQENPNIVIVTAYDHYAIQAFELNALDYILKPVQKDRLIKTLERIKTKLQKRISPGKIKFDCFRHFSMTVAGKELSSGWRTRKAEELLAYLICEKGRFIAKEKIADALWPELENRKSVANLYLAYYYLKKQLETVGIELPVESERGKMRIRLEETDCDIVKFELLMNASRNINNETIGSAEEAFGLYKGTLLEDRYYVWAIEQQQNYEIAYLELLKRIVEYYKQVNNPEKYEYYLKKFNEF